jgi:hypothetical protein
MYTMRGFQACAAIIPQNTDNAAVLEPFYAPAYQIVLAGNACLVWAGRAAIYDGVWSLQPPHVLRQQAMQMKLQDYS